MTASSEQDQSRLELTAEDLDFRYGELVKPWRVDANEYFMAPASLQQLDGDTSLLLRQLMEAARHGLRIASHVYAEVPILWIVDKAGNIFFGLEELVDEFSDTFRRPRMKRTPLVSGTERLGHPALVGGQAARIAGEILFDVRAAEPAWVISNASGRYGLVKGRREAHLMAVAEDFSRYGIALRPFFLSPIGDGT